MKKLHPWQMPRNTVDMTLGEVWKRDVEKWISRYNDEVEKHRDWMEDPLDGYMKDLINFIENKEYEIGLELGLVSPWQRD
jgi:hypothetical protein